MEEQATMGMQAHILLTFHDKILERNNKFENAKFSQWLFSNSSQSVVLVVRNVQS